MVLYYVKANDAEGYYEAEDDQGARDALARDAGYESEADMADQLEQPSEIVARSIWAMADAEMEEHFTRPEVRSMPPAASSAKAAVIEARRTSSGGLRFWCDHCRGWHSHSAEYGHRVEHCWRPGSPYAGRGYILIPEKKDA